VAAVALVLSIPAPALADAAGPIHLAGDVLAANDLHAAAITW